MKTVDVEVLQSLLRYEPDTGKLFWRVRDASWFRDTPNKTAHQHCNWWNKRFAGKEAFTAPGVENCRCGRVLGVGLYAHRVIWAMVHGVWPPEVDHEDGDRSNNRLRNLRAADHQSNMQNKAVYRNSKSGVHGVSRDATGLRWHARITVNKRQRHLGTFATKDEAIAARRSAEREAGGFHSNHGRAPCLAS